MIKFPVFYRGKNYTGHQPKIEKSALLSKFAYHRFVDEINTLPNSSLIIPLGKKVDVIVDELREKGKVNQVCLKGYPHPSGANGHRIKEFNKNKHSLIDKIDDWKRYRTEN